MTRTLLFVTLPLFACTTASSTPPRDAANPAPTMTVVRLTGANGDSIGTATLSPDARGVTIALAVRGLSPGEHAIHVHHRAHVEGQPDAPTTCEGPAFTSAGGHFNPEQKKHGLNNPEGPHAGDMPNFTVDASGRSSATVVASGVTLANGPRSVFTGGGTALVIHEKADDMTTDPAGNAGARIACGVIRK
jgi:Cu-Zn family superoxide dismutase